MIPPSNHFVRRADDKYGKAFQKYLTDVRSKAREVTKKEIKPSTVTGSFTKLVEFEPENVAIDKTITSIMYEQSPSTSYENILQQVKKISKENTRLKS